MGQRANRVVSPERLEHDVEKIRAGLTEVVGELDRRRHELTDWRRQLRKHAGLLVAAGTALVLAGGVVTGVAVYRARSRRRHQERRAEPRTVVQGEGIGHRLLSTALAALAGVLVKTFAQRAVGWSERRALPS